MEQAEKNKTFRTGFDLSAQPIIHHEIKTLLLCV